MMMWEGGWKKDYGACDWKGDPTGWVLWIEHVLIVIHLLFDDDGGSKVFINFTAEKGV